MRLTLLPLAVAITAAAPPIPVHGPADWRAEAARVTITRDDWGIAHVHGRTDADAVFGMIYAQAEDDFPRIEANYLTALGRTAEADGEKAIWQDLRARLYVSEGQLKALYWKSPQSMRRLMDAWADGLNFYLATHPAEKPKVLTRFEPWMALSFTEGSIGGDIEKIDLKELEEFYDKTPKLAAPLPAPKDAEPTGSNGIVIAPRLTKDGHALLLINPHTSYYFRSELQMTSDEGLNAYGAVTWGQPFIYQGFNSHMGWMHPTSGVDNVDEFAERVEAQGNGFCYRYGAVCRPLTPKAITLKYRTVGGTLKGRDFTAWMTHRGPIVRAEGGRWIAFAMMDRPVEALQQSFLRTKARDVGAFMKVGEIRANSTNATLVADDKGNIAYLHPQFVPVRNARADYSKAVDGSDPTLDWRGLHSVASLPNSIRPRTGFAFNTNNWPWTTSGSSSPRKNAYPAYMDSFGENSRGLHALGLLTRPTKWTLDGLQSAAYDSAQPGFARLIPPLIAAYDKLPATDPRKARLREPIAALHGWDMRWSADSVPNTLASVWAARLWEKAEKMEWDDLLSVYNHIEQFDPGTMIEEFDAGVGGLKRDFGKWAVPWGELNRFQRISSDIDNRFDDKLPSLPVPFTSGRWGSLASIGSWPAANTKKWYGQGGNSFVAVIEFGPRIRARAITAGGESGRVGSKHFNDQAARFVTGNLRDVYFYPDQLAGHTERTYRPGE